MTQDEMKNLLLLNVDDLAQHIFTDNTLSRFFNQASRYIYTRILGQGIYPVVGEETVSFSSGNQIINLTSDIRKVIQVLDSDNIPIDIISEEDSRRSQYPTVFIRRFITPPTTSQGVYQLGWYRDPNSTFDLVAKYVPNITEFDTSSYVGTLEQEDIPEQYHNVIVLRATLYALGKDEQKINYWQQLYNEEFDAMMMDLKPQGAEDQGVVDLNYGYY